MECEIHAPADSLNAQWLNRRQENKLMQGHQAGLQRAGIHFGECSVSGERCCN